MDLPSTNPSEEHPMSVEQAQPQPEPQPGKITVGKDGLPVGIPEEPTAAIGKDGQPADVPDVSDHFGRLQTGDEEEEEHSDESTQKKPLSFPATVMNLLNSLLGAGILSVPNTFCDTGYILTTVLLIVIAALSYVATFMVIEIQKRTKGDGFGDLAFRTLGKWGLVILDILTLLFLVSAQLAYLILGTDMIVSWFALGNIDVSGTWLRALVTAVYSLCIPIALTIPRNIAFLRYFSTATVAFIFFYVVVLTYKGIDYLVGNSGHINSTCIKSHFDMSGLNTVSILALTFALPCVCLPSLKLYVKETNKRNLVSFTTVLVCAIFVLLPSIFGYFIFGENTDSNVLNSFSNKDILMVVTRGVFFFVVSFAFPMVGQSTLSSWSSIIYKVDAANNLTRWKRLVVLLLTDGIPLIVAMFLSSAKPILSIGGAIGGCCANFMFPAIMFFLTSKQRWFHWKNLLTILFAIFGLVAGILSTYQAVVTAIDSF